MQRLLSNRFEYEHCDIGMIQQWVENRVTIAVQDCILKAIQSSGFYNGDIYIKRSKVNANEIFPDGTGRTLFHLLFEFPLSKGKLVFQAIFSEGPVQLRLQDDEGRTALIWAVEAGNLVAVKAIAAEIVRRNEFSVFLLKTNKGENAEEIADRLGLEQVRRILSKKRIKLLEQINKELRRKVEPPTPRSGTIFKNLPFQKEHRRRTQTCPEVMRSMTLARRALLRWERLIVVETVPLGRKRSKSVISFKHVEHSLEPERRKFRLRRSGSTDLLTRSLESPLSIKRKSGFSSTHPGLSQIMARLSIVDALTENCEQSYHISKIDIIKSLLFAPRINKA